MRNRKKRMKKRMKKRKKKKEVPPSELVKVPAFVGGDLNAERNPIVRKRKTKGDAVKKHVLRKEGQELLIIIM